MFCYVIIGTDYLCKDLAGIPGCNDEMAASFDIPPLREDYLINLGGANFTFIKWVLNHLKYWLTFYLKNARVTCKHTYRSLANPSSLPFHPQQ